MLKNRKGYKICPRCKVEYALTCDNYSISKTSGRPHSICKKCRKFYDAKRYESSGNTAICHCCRAKFIISNDLNHTGKFCSRSCAGAFRARDDRNLLARRGLTDLNESYNYQKEF